MKRSLLHVILLISFFTGLVFVQPKETVHASSPTQTKPESIGVIAYIKKGKNAENGDVWIVDARGENKAQLTFEGGFEELAWSPDGQILALMKTRESGHRRDLYIKDLTADPPKKIGDRVNTFAWDPDGTRIAYSADQIYVVNVKEQADQITIPVEYEINWMFWDISGNEIVYYSSYTESIYSVNIFTQQKQTLYSRNVELNTAP
jgi:Tol biopolymer transport system component